MILASKSSGRQPTQAAAAQHARAWPTVLALALFFANGGCGASSLEVRSTPASARVYVNGEEVGRTPYALAMSFEEAERVWIQVVHPAGRTVGEACYTRKNVPSRPVDFDLR